MPDENPNKFSDWKNRLDALEYLPGEMLNKAAAWEKLHQRLQEKPSKKRYVWYWWAAACLLIAFFTLPLVFERKEALLVNQNTSQKHPYHPPIDSKIVMVREDTAEAINKIFINTKQKNPSTVKANKINHSQIKGMVLKEVVSEKRVSPGYIIEEAMLAVPKDTVESAVAVVKSRPKLRVVHINELNQPAEEVKLALSSSASFPIKITNKDIFSTYPTDAGSEHHFLKINISPQN